MDHLLSQFLSLADIKRMGIPTDSGFFVGNQFFKNIFPKNYSRKTLQSELIEDISLRLHTYFPICGRIVDHCNISDITILMSSQPDGSFEFTYNYKQVLSWFFTYFISRYPSQFSNYFKTLDAKLSGLAIEDSQFEDEIRNIFMDIFKKINALFSSKAGDTNFSDQEREMMVEDRRVAKYFVKNIHEILAVIMQPIRVSFPEDLNKDRLLLALNQRVLSDLENGNGTFEQTKRQINFIECYLAIVHYFVQKENSSYNPFFVSESNDTFSYLDLKKGYQAYCDRNEELVSSCRVQLEMDQIFRQYLLDARKNIKKEEFVKAIQLNFQFFPKGIGNKRGGTFKHSKIDEDLQILLQEKHAKMLQDKIDFYSSTDYLWTLEEEQAFSGYRGYIYPNGKVVFDKFYHITRDGLVPAFNESIITMDLVDFIEMAPQSKSELLDLIRSHKSKSVRRLYHTLGWEDRVCDIISQENSNYDFYLIESLLTDISKEVPKVYGKSNS